MEQASVIRNASPSDGEAKEGNYQTVAPQHRTYQQDSSVNFTAQNIYIRDEKDVQVLCH